MENLYESMLKGFLKVRWVAWIVVAACGGIIWFCMGTLKSELAPLEDRSSIRFKT